MNPHELDVYLYHPVASPRQFVRAQLRSSFSNVSETAHAGYEDGDPTYMRPAAINITRRLFTHSNLFVLLNSTDPMSTISRLYRYDGLSLSSLLLSSYTTGRSVS